VRIARREKINRDVVFVKAHPEVSKHRVILSPLLIEFESSAPSATLQPIPDAFFHVDQKIGVGGGSWSPQKVSANAPTSM
jgi:hypothetical protein